jgi:hypothetical protein
MRMEAGFTQEQLAARLQVRGWPGARQDVLTRIESSKRGLSDTELLLILRALGKGPADIKVPRRLV